MNILKLINGRMSYREGQTILYKSGNATRIGLVVLPAIIADHSCRPFSRNTQAQKVNSIQFNPFSYGIDNFAYDI